MTWGRPRPADLWRDCLRRDLIGREAGPGLPGGPARGLTIYYGPDIDMKRRVYAGVGSSPGFVLGDIYMSCTG